MQKTVSTRCFFADDGWVGGGVGWATISIPYPARVHTESPSLAAAFAACSATAAIFFPYLDANLVGEWVGADFR